MFAIYNTSQKSQQGRTYVHARTYDVQANTHIEVLQQQKSQLATATLAILRTKKSENLCDKHHYSTS